MTKMKKFAIKNEHPDALCLHVEEVMPHEVSSKKLAENLREVAFVRCPNLVFDPNWTWPSGIKRIVIEDCQLCELTFISELKQLKRLYLPHNRLTELPLGLQHCLNLVKLNLSRNQISNLVNFPGLPLLEEIDLNSNKLAIFPAELKQLTRLRVLRLMHNFITQVDVGFLQSS
jgi:Leucine-rich repeat (LRR) protein